MSRSSFFLGSLRGGPLLMLGLLFAAGCMHNRPDAPAIPVGPSSVELDSAYTYRTFTSFPREYGLVWVRFDWGDGDTSQWCGHDETVACSHSWREGGVFAVRAQARDQRTEFSEWSAPCSLTAIVPPYPYRLVDSVAVIDAPLYDVLVLPGGDYVYVTNDYSGALSVVRISDLQLVAQIPFNGGWSSSGQVVCSPDGQYVYATCFRDDWVAVVRTEDQVVVDSLMVDGEVLSVAIAPDGKRLYAAVDADSGFIVVVRVPDNVIEDTIFTPGVSNYITSMKVAPDGSCLYAMNLEEGCVCAMRLSDNTIEWQVRAWGPEAPGGVVLHPTGDPLYALKRECVLVLASATGAVVDSVLLSTYWSSEILPDGSFLYVTCGVGEDSGAVAVVRTSDNKVVRVIAMPDEVLDVAPTPDGQRLYVAGGNGKLYVLGR